AARDGARHEKTAQQRAASAERAPRGARAGGSVRGRAEVGTFPVTRALHAALGLLPAAHGGPHEAREQRVRRHRPALELRMELTADEVGVIVELDDLDQAVVGAHAAQAEARGLERLAIVVVDLEAVAMPLADEVAPVELRAAAARLQHAVVGAE